MKIRREHTRYLHIAFDQFLPPIIRDSRWFCYIVFKIFFGKNAHLFLNFKERITRTNQAQLNELYREINSCCIERDTDLNEACLDRIEKDVLGKNLLEVGCGRLFLANKLAKRFAVTAVDVDISESSKLNTNGIVLIQSPIDNLPFGDQQFDTVISTHTLEHVIDFSRSLESLRRVTARRLIVVVPMQRAYKYTFDAHLQFFPNISAFLIAARPQGRYLCEEVGGDIYFLEDRSLQATFPSDEVQ